MGELAGSRRGGGGTRHSGAGRALILSLLALALTAVIAPAAASARPPTPEPNTAVELSPRPCAYEDRGDEYERDFYRREGWGGPDYERYPGSCQRLRFSFGPIAVKPGQNDVLIEPITIEKPNRDGYITRFAPNLVRADGTVPPTEQVHLHHGTWLSYPEYGKGPFFASGEEKTIAPFPKGYGLPIKASDTWLLLYMVHSAVQQPMEMYITYDIDFVPQAKAEDLALKPAYPVWLDVRPSGYPVYNVQRDFGGADGKCTWPKEQCAAHDPWGKKFVGQGEPGNGIGEDEQLPGKGETMGRIRNFTGGTLIGIGGHVHPGGLTNDIDLVRPGNTVSVRKKNGKRVRRKKEVQRIYTAEAAYWDRKDKTKAGGPPTSWDFSMEVTGLPYWGVRVNPGDILRSNATYDTRMQSTYENMGIAVTLLVPNDENGKPQAPGVNPFKVKVDKSDSCKSQGLKAKRKPRLCDKGIVTHGHLKENDNFGGPQGDWNARRGLPTTRVGIADFLYEPGDLSTISMTGVPTVSLGNTLKFNNTEGHSIWHTVTSCGFPCLGPTGTSYPLSNGTTSAGRPVDFDSSELGYGPPAIGPAKQTQEWDLPISREEGFQPGEIVTYFCRIHPSMRGAFEVTE